MGNWYLDDLFDGEPPNPAMQGTVFVSTATTMTILMDNGHVLKSSAVPGTGDGKSCDELYPVGKRIALRPLDDPN
jgi:hypothetical protein